MSISPIRLVSNSLKLRYETFEIVLTKFSSANRLGPAFGNFYSHDPLEGNLHHNVYNLDVQFVSYTPRYKITEHVR